VLESFKTTGQEKFSGVFAYLLALASRNPHKTAQLQCTSESVRKETQFEHEKGSFWHLKKSQSDRVVPHERTCWSTASAAEGHREIG
jgi:hypothetical protein